MAPVLSIAVIGGGPSGLSFVHAIEQQFQKTGQEVKVTCFERSSQPGGVWRAADPNAAADATDMYEQLWSNGSSHMNEFFDYTYDDHFGEPVEVYMNRKDLLEYILGRVTDKCPNFFEKYVELSTSVDYVVYNDNRKKFDITVRDTATQQTATRQFDKCVWACGENGKQNMPESLVNIFRDGGYRGRLIHSADTRNLEADVRGKRILIVGGGFSAEDLALQAIKLGVEKVYVSARTSSSEICWTKNWPMDKVKVLREQMPLQVTEEGNCIQFCEVTWTPYGYKRYGDYVESSIRDIDTVILGTGYHINMDFLDPSLRKGFPTAEYKTDRTFTVASDWKMPENELSKYTGEVEVAETVRYGYPCYVHPELYQGVLIQNPNMMFISAYGSHLPLLACDVYAWLLAGYATGSIELPTAETMKELNEKEVRNMMNFPYFRYLMDDNYWKAVDALEDFWPEDSTEACEPWDEVEYEEWILSMKRLAGVMKEAQYPFDIGDTEELNDNGKAIVEFGDLGYYHREKLEFADDEEKRWKTFRDVSDADKFYSLFTGTKCVPPKKRWMDTQAVPEESTDDEKKIDEL